MNDGEVKAKSDNVEMRVGIWRKMIRFRKILLG